MHVEFPGKPSHNAFEYMGELHLIKQKSFITVRVIPGSQRPLRKMVPNFG